LLTRAFGGWVAHQDAPLFESGDPEQIKQTKWFYGYTTAAKAQIKLESQNFAGLLEVICIEGGPITKLEAQVRLVLSRPYFGTLQRKLHMSNIVGFLVTHYTWRHLRTGDECDHCRSKVRRCKELCAVPCAVASAFVLRLLAHL
jgi:hypothetical protein